MTEEEWLTATDPQSMLQYLRGTASERKVRLFAVACCGPLVPLLDCNTCKSVLTVAESLADNTADEVAVAAAREHAWNEYKNYGDAFRYLDAAATLILAAIDHQPHEITRLSASVTADGVASEGCEEEAEGYRTLGRTQPYLLRCVIGNPFRPVEFDPRWRSESAAALATGIYAERAFDRLPILADALEEAGCDHADLLAHCRGPGPHARGCWVVDLVLNKS